MFDRKPIPPVGNRTDKQRAAVSRFICECRGDRTIVEYAAFLRIHPRYIEDAENGTRDLNAEQIAYIIHKAETPDRREASAEDDGPITLGDIVGPFAFPDLPENSDRRASWPPPRGNDRWPIYATTSGELDPGSLVTLPIEYRVAADAARLFGYGVFRRETLERCGLVCLKTGLYSARERSAIGRAILSVTLTYEMGAKFGSDSDSSNVTLNNDHALESEYEQRIWDGVYTQFADDMTKRGLVWGDLAKLEGLSAVKAFAEDTLPPSSTSASDSTPLSRSRLRKHAAAGIAAIREAWNNHNPVIAGAILGIVIFGAMFVGFAYAQENYWDHPTSTSLHVITRYSQATAPQDRDPSDFAWTATAEELDQIQAASFYAVHPDVRDDYLTGGYWNTPTTVSAYRSNRAKDAYWARSKASVFGVFGALDQSTAKDMLPELREAIHVAFPRAAWYVGRPHARAATLARCERRVYHSPDCHGAYLAAVYTSSVPRGFEPFDRADVRRTAGLRAWLHSALSRFPI